MTPLDSTQKPRRHDLDALRAFAMLLGILLHGMLSFMPGIWPVQDSHQNRNYYLVFAALHGFRMPLFFLVSGFFTAMLWRKRGLGALLKQRATRILLPMVIGLFTVVPAVNYISGQAIVSAIAHNDSPPSQVARDSASVNDSIDIWTAVATGNTQALERHLRDGIDIDAKHPSFGHTLLMQAVLSGQPTVVGLLLDRGADVNAQGQDGSTPLHTAAFFGRVPCVDLLLQHGADTTVRNSYGQNPHETMSADWATTRFVASLLKLPLDRETVEAGRIEAKKHFTNYESKAGDESAAETDPEQDEEIKNGQSRWETLASMLMAIPVFHHLWFLWFLCWLVASFTVFAWVANKLSWQGAPPWLVLSPARWFWIIPLTMIPQWFMGGSIPVFGPDTSIGLLPIPQVLGYYAIFFAFGALYFDSKDDTGRVGKWWAFSLPLSLFVVLPLGLIFIHEDVGLRDRLLGARWHRLVGDLMQVIYAWSVSFGLLGMFRSLLPSESRSIRYLSDSSYWLYLMHVPLVIAVQWAVRDWNFPSIIKCLLTIVVVSALLLFSYQFLVRYTWIGRMLNGPRQRSKSVPSASPQHTS